MHIAQYLRPISLKYSRKILKEFIAEKKIGLYSARLLKYPAWLSSYVKVCQLNSARQNPARFASAQLADFQLGCITNTYLSTYYGIDYYVFKNTSHLIDAWVTLRNELLLWFL